MKASEILYYALNANMQVQYAMEYCWCSYWGSYFMQYHAPSVAMLQSEVFLTKLKRRIMSSLVQERGETDGGHI